MDDTKKTGKGDDSRININERYELQYWAGKFNVTQEQLVKAVAATGPMASAVEKYLKTKKE